MNFECTYETILQTCPDCLCYIPKKQQVLMGCYELDQGIIRGELHLLQQQNYQLQKLITVESSGVLDLKYVESLNLVITCTVSSDINFYDETLKLIKSINLNNHESNERAEEIKNLFISYYHSLEKNQLILFIGTDSGTSIQITLDHFSLQEITCSFIYSHKYSVWSTYIQDSNISYSGSDDQCLIMYDSRTPQLTINKKLQSISHQMGVSFIIGTNGSELITASYDSYLRVWDPSMLTQPLREIKRPGGVWRVVKQKQLLLNALFTENCYEILDLQSETVVQTLGGHESLAYGCDWNGDTIVTLSFYDKRLRLWKQSQDN